jgi:hypothetical protein
MTAFSDLNARDLTTSDHPRFQLLSPLIFYSHTGTIVVPAGTTTDFASVPRVLWNIIPPVGAYDPAAVVHDYAYQTGRLPGLGRLSRAEADDLLLEGMQLLHVRGLQRWAIYRGVRFGGWVPWNRYRRADVVR